MVPVIAAQDVSYHVGDKRIVSGVDFSGARGEFVGLLGPNGAGKSTMLRLLAGLILPSSGSVTIDGKNLKEMRPVEVARRIAYVPQDTHVAFDFSVWEIVLMGRHPHLPRFAVEGNRDHEIVALAMERVGVRHLADRSITSLSGGERQMVFIAKALAQQPQVLLLDEPVSALDIRHQLHVLSLVRSYTENGATAVAVLHDLNLAARFCDRLYLMADGEVTAQGTPDAVYTEESLARSYRVRAAVRYDPLVKSPTVTALDAFEESGGEREPERPERSRQREQSPRTL